MKRWIISIIMTALIGSDAFAQAPAQPMPRTISTSGESTVYVAPDEVVVNVGVETFSQKLDDAKAENDQASARLIKAIKDLGVESRHLQTAELEIQLRYRNSEPIQGVEGYYARRAYAVTLKDVKLFEKLVDSALKNGANRLMGFEYRNTELRKHRDQARKMAVKAAKEKAELLAHELECRVGMVHTVNENTPVYSGYWGSRWGGGNSYMTQNAMQFDPGQAGAGEALPLGQIAIRASVHVSFDLIGR
jgi:uncharacterized protein